MIHPSSVLSRCHFRKGRTAQQHMLGNGIQPDLPRIHMAYADGWLAPCGLKGNDDDDEKDDKDSASISSALVDILWRVLLFLFTTKYLSAIYHNSIPFLSILSALEIKEHANAVYHMFFRLYGGKPSRKKTLGNPTGRSSFGCRVHSIWQRQTSSPLSQYRNGASVVFFHYLSWTCVWIWHCLRQQHHCCRIVGKPASQCIWIYSIWDDQNCCFWSQIQFGQADKTQTE